MIKNEKLRTILLLIIVSILFSALAYKIYYYQDINEKKSKEIQEICTQNKMVVYNYSCADINTGILYSPELIKKYGQNE